jgi:hypothetical protein
MGISMLARVKNNPCIRPVDNFSRVIFGTSIIRMPVSQAYFLVSFCDEYVVMGKT